MCVPAWTRSRPYSQFSPHILLVILLDGLLDRKLLRGQCELFPVLLQLKVDADAVQRIGAMEVATLKFMSLLICLFILSLGARLRRESVSRRYASAPARALPSDMSCTMLSGDLASPTPVDIFPRYLLPLAQGTNTPRQCISVCYPSTAFRFFTS